ncbi:hybrid sensor histidine kinase/response regulator [Calditrichota bacterium GD2]
MYKRTVYFVIILSLFLTFDLFAVESNGYPSPHYPYIRYTVDNGLPQSIISSLVQDAYGFLWLATNEGAARFDGSSFQVFNEENGYPFRLVTGIIEKEPGIMWISTISNGVWELHNNKLRKISLNGALSTLHINFMIKTYDNEILIGAEPGGLYVVKNDSLILHLDERKGEIVSKILCGAKDYNGNYWVGSFDSGLQAFDGTKLISHLTTKDGLPSNEIRTILPLPSGEVWIGTNRGFFIKGRPDLTRMLNRLFPEVFVSSIYTPNNQDIWINLATKPGGVLHFKNDRLMEILHANDGFYSKSTLIDEQGALFIGTYRGLYVYPNRNFENFGKESGLTDTYIRAIGKDPAGNVLIATKSDGIFKLAGQNFEKLAFLDEALRGNSVHDIKPINNQLWLATTRGLFIVENNRLIQNKWTHFFKGMYLRRFELIDGDWYIVAHRALYKIRNDSLIDLSYNLKKRRVSIWGVAKDKKDRLIIATNGNGLQFLDNQTWRQLHPPDSLEQFFAIRPDEDNNLYIGNSKGLCKWDGSHFELLLPLNKTVWDVLPTQTEIWALTSYGLYKMQNGRVRIYNKKNGLVTTEFNMGARCMTDHNDYWFGGVDGLVHYYKKKNYPDLVPKFYINAIELEDSLFNYPFPAEIVLPSSKNALRFHLNKIDFGNGPSLKLAYWLKGFDQDTVFLSDSKVQYVDYTNLPDGAYTFLLFLADPFTHQIVAQRSVSFIILRPWYKTNLFIFSAALLMLGLIYVIVHARESYLKRRNLLLEQQVLERTEDIRQSYKLLKKETEQRKKAQASLREERRQLEITLKSIGDGVVRTDLEGKILLLNDSAGKILGISIKEAMGKTLNEILQLKDEDENTEIHLPEYVQQWEDQENAPPYFYALLTSSDSKEKKFLNISWSKIKGENGEGSGYVWVFRDISAERQLENEILKSQKLESIGLLAGGIAHDFNNILAGILGNAQLAKLNWQERQDIQKYLDGIEEAAQNASRLTKQLLTFAKGGEPVKEIISLKKILIENVEFALRGSNVSCKFIIDDDLWPVEADKGQINQAINNLVINAIQAMPGGGQLVVKAKNCNKKEIAHLMPEIEKEHYVEIQITDTGLGIQRENLDKIFDPYFTTKQRGSGLGLATTYAIIKKHGGHIKVDSELGRGTTFTIWLPAFPEQDVVEKKQDMKIDSFKGKRVLVMDDEEFILELMGSFLEMIGVEAEFAKDGEEAIEKYKQALEKKQRFDAVIMDLTIRGGMGGKEAISQILKIDPSAKVIVASGYSTDSLLANFQHHGFVGRLSKPFTLDELNKVLGEALNSDQ